MSDSVSRAGIAHADVLAAVHSRAFGDRGWSAGSFAELLVQTNVDAWIGALTDGPAGLILTRGVREEAEVLTIGVAPPARRRGVGGALLAAAEDAQRAAGRRFAFLEVSEANGAARALYEGFRYRPAGRRRAYYPDGSDALILRKRLDGQA
ncbi:MAG: GNAT family N-acetyltransferase [Pseudomonadota bacterium]